MWKAASGESLVGEYTGGGLEWRGDCGALQAQWNELDRARRARRRTLRNKNYAHEFVNARKVLHTPFVAVIFRGIDRFQKFC